MKSESRFWRSLKDKIPGHSMRVENGCLPGVPDVNICHCGKEVWVELKDTDSYPARAETRVFGPEGLRPEQILWINQRFKHGGNVYIVAKVAKDIYCISGEYANDFNNFNRKELVEKSLDYREILGMVLGS